MKTTCAGQGQVTGPLQGCAGGTLATLTSPWSPNHSDLGPPPKGFGSCWITNSEFGGLFWPGTMRRGQVKSGKLFLGRDRDTSSYGFSLGNLFKEKKRISKLRGRKNPQGFLQIAQG